VRQVCLQEEQPKQKIVRSALMLMEWLLHAQQVRMQQSKQEESDCGMLFPGMKFQQRVRIRRRLHLRVLQQALRQALRQTAHDLPVILQQSFRPEYEAQRADCPVGATRQLCVSAERSVRRMQELMPARAPRLKPALL
jgi:predicted glycosyl hydrolase (DUF1957 family)